MCRKRFKQAAAVAFGLISLGAFAAQVFFRGWAPWN